MLNKKSAKANLEDKKAISLLIGFVLALSVLYVSLEWSSERTIHVVAAYPEIPSDVVVVIPQTKQDNPPAPQPPKMGPKEALPQAATEFTTVDNNSGTITPPGIPSPEPDVDPMPTGPAYVPIEEPEEIVDFLPSEDMPIFPGNVLEYLAKSIRYPVIDIEQGIKGKVICQFVIDKDGSITDFQIVRGVSPSIDKEAKRVVESMPKWTPGKQRGKAVKVRYTLPINFTLQ